MDPIDVRADTTYTQALRCMQYRLPSSSGFRAPGYVLAVGLRYGLIGIAASHHLLITAEEGEEQSIFGMIDRWPEAVRQHVQWDIGHRLPFTTNSEVSHLIGKIAALPLHTYLPLYQRLWPLSKALVRVGEEIVDDNKAMIVEGWSWLKRKNAFRTFEASLAESQEFAVNFFERRQADLEELPEIALIGE